MLGARRRQLQLSRLLALGVLCCALGLSSGCVERRLTLRSNPPGALVYVDDYEIGTTPCSTKFTYYGKRKIRLVKDGFETLTTEQWILPPVYEIFPLDFVSENLIPWELRDERNIELKMVPQRVIPTDQLLEQGENLRQFTNTQAAMPPSSGQPFWQPQAQPPALPQAPQIMPPAGGTTPGVVPPPGPSMPAQPELPQRNTSPLIPQS